MANSSGYDLLIILSGIACALIGIIAGLWGLFWDRSRGRKRCPKCWYNMSGTPSLVCSECGHEAISEKKQLKTRRRWRVLIVCIVVFATGLGAIGYGLTNAGWREFVPTTVLVFLMPDLQKDNPKLYDQLRKRMNKDSLWDWQWEWLFDRCVDDLSQSALVKVYARPVWDKDKPIEYMVNFDWIRTGVEWVDAAYVDLDLTLNGESVAKHDRSKIFDKSIPTPSVVLGLAGIYNSNMLAEDNRDLIFDVEANFQHGDDATPWWNLSAAKRFSRTFINGSGQVVKRTSSKLVSGYLNSHKINRSYQLRVPIRVVGSSDGSNTTPANSTLLKRIRGHTWLTKTEDGIFLTTLGRVWGEPYGITLALKFEFLYKGSVVASTNALLIINEAGSISLDLHAVGELDYQALLKDSADDWSVRISGNDDITKDVWMPYSWGGEFELPMHIKIEAGKPVPVWSAEGEQTFADLDEG